VSVDDESLPVSATDNDSSALFVRRSRARLNLTQAELAEELGLHRRSIVRFEHGDPLPLQTRLAIRLLLWKHVRKHRRANDRDQS
jgi:DNA-binding XRE family transcriptional regulator